MLVGIDRYKAAVSLDHLGQVQADIIGLGEGSHWEDPGQVPLLRREVQGVEKEGMCLAYLACVAFGILRSSVYC